MHPVITTPQQVTPGWLTAVLRERGALTEGEVLRVTPGPPRSSFASSIWNLEISYSGPASSHPPEKLFLKCSDPAAAPGVVDPTRLQQEIVFYQEVAPEMAAPFIIPCYSAARDPHTGASHILLEDVSATHVPVSTPPALQNYEQAVDALAGLHAFWWDHPSLGKQIGSFPTPAERQQECIQAQQVTNAFMDYLGDRLPQSWREIYLRVLPALPHLFQRHESGRNLTLAHGDAHLGNFLFPKSTDGGQAYLLDWQFWHPTIAATDLTYMLAPETEIDTRRQIEVALHRRYHQRLLAHGVQAFTWEQCWDDYRLSVILLSIFIPVWRWSLFQWEADLTALERSMTAFEDLRCAALL